MYTLPKFYNAYAAGSATMFFHFRTPASSSCGWGDHCNHCDNSKKTQLQTPFGPPVSVDSLCHPRITTTHLSYSVLSLKLPPLPCAVLLVYIVDTAISFRCSCLFPQGIEHYTKHEDLSENRMPVDGFTFSHIFLIQKNIRSPLSHWGIHRKFQSTA